MAIANELSGTRPREDFVVFKIPNMCLCSWDFHQKDGRKWWTLKFIYRLCKDHKRLGDFPK